MHGVLRYLDRHQVRHPGPPVADCGQNEPGTARLEATVSGDSSSEPAPSSDLRRSLSIRASTGRPAAAKLPRQPKRGRESGSAAAEDCLVFLRDRFPAYIPWDRFDGEPDGDLAANRNAGRVRLGQSAERGGPAGRNGVVRKVRASGCLCGTGRSDRSGRPTYLPAPCGSADYGDSRCVSRLSNGTAGVEEWVAEQVLAALRPAALGSQPHGNGRCGRPHAGKT